MGYGVAFVTSQNLFPSAASATTGGPILSDMFLRSSEAEDNLGLLMETLTVLVILWSSPSFSLPTCWFPLCDKHLFFAG